MTLDAVAYQGVPGAFGEQAAAELAPGAAERLACASFGDLFEAVSSKRARWGAVPIENSLGGSVHACYDLLERHPLAVVAEKVLRIAHALIAPGGVGLGEIRRVLSHPMALAQCEKFLRGHRSMEAVAAENTAAAVKEVVEGGRRDSAAIASARAATIYGGRILLEDLEDDPCNFTRFLLLARPEDAAPPRTEVTRPLKTSLLFRVENRPAALFEALRPFAERGINLTKIESRPIRGSRFESLFYLDAVVPADRQANVDAALADLSARSTALRRLGTYPAGEEKKG